MLTDDERRTMEVLYTCERWWLPEYAAMQASELRYLRDVASSAVASGFIRVVHSNYSAFRELTPSGRDKLNRLRAKANESEVGDE